MFCYVFINVNYDYQFVKDFLTKCNVNLVVLCVCDSNTHCHKITTFNMPCKKEIWMNNINNIRIRSLNIQYTKPAYLIVMKFTALTKLVIKILYIDFLSNLKFLWNLTILSFNCHHGLPRLLGCPDKLLEFINSFI